MSILNQKAEILSCDSLILLVLLCSDSDCGQSAPLPVMWPISNSLVMAILTSVFSVLTVSHCSIASCWLILSWYIHCVVFSVTFLQLIVLFIWFWYWWWRSPILTILPVSLLSITFDIVVPFAMPGYLQPVQKIQSAIINEKLCRLTMRRGRLAVMYRGETPA